MFDPQAEPRVLALAAQRRSPATAKAVLKLLCSQFGSTTEFLKGSDEHLAEQLGLGKDELNRAVTDIAQWRSTGIETLSIDDTDYPPLLRHIHEPPALLFARGGQLRELRHFVPFAIVGSRKADPLTAKETEHFSAKLVQQSNATIISGLALGIDTAAHRGALQSGRTLPTVAVLGCGVDCVYPRSNALLADELISKGGILLSQFEPGTLPLPHHFLNRNRVIAGMSCGVLVAQAAVRSGALSTVRHALEEGREVFAFPGHIADRRFEGSNRIIKDGAVLVTEVEDLNGSIAGLQFRLHGEQESHAEQQSPDEKMVLEALGRDQKLGYADLLEITGLHERLPAVLVELELQERVLRLPGNVYALTRR